MDEEAAMEQQQQSSTSRRWSSEPARPGCRRRTTSPGAGRTSSSSTRTSGSVTTGAATGTRCGSTARPWRTRCRACGSRRRARPTRPRTRWPTTSRPTASASTCRSAAGSGCAACRPVTAGYLVTCTDGTVWTCDNVVVATGTFGRTPHVPAFAGDLDPAIRQLHSSDYKRPAQLQPGAGPRRRRLALGRRHRLRGRHGRSPGRAERPHPRRGAVPAGEAGRPGGVPGAALRRPPPADDADTRWAARSGRRSGRTAAR